MPSIVGLAIFTQFWYWYPLVHFISLSFTPTAIIGLNKDLKTPKFDYKSNIRPSFFAYPPDVKPPTTAAVTKAPTAILSTAKKSKKKEEEKGPTPMDLSTSSLGTSESADKKKRRRKERRREKT